MSNAEQQWFQAIPCAQFNPSNLSSNWQPVFSINSTGAISGATNANPCVITSVGHGLVTGSVVTIQNVGGMVQLNGNSYVITVINSSSFSLNGVDSTNYGVYTSGGIWFCYGGFPDNIKILELFNGAAVSMDYSYDGISQHGVWPSGATLIIDLQANHADNPPYGSGTLNGNSGQNVWVRTSVNPTWLTIGGYR